MGNIGSSGVNNRRRPRGNVSGRRIHPPPPPPVMPQPEITSNRFMYPAAASATPYQNYPGYYPPPPPTMPLPAPYDHHHLQVMDPMWGRYPQLPPPPPPAPYVEHQKTVTIKNDINIKKETLRIEPDEENPGRFLVSLTFDATIDGRVQFPLTIRGVRLNSEVNCC